MVYIYKDKIDLWRLRTPFPLTFTVIFYAITDSQQNSDILVAIPMRYILTHRNTLNHTHSLILHLCTKLKICIVKTIIEQQIASLLWQRWLNMRCAIRLTLTSLICSILYALLVLLVAVLVTTTTSLYDLST